MGSGIVLSQPSTMSCEKGPGLLRRGLVQDAPDEPGTLVIKNRASGRPLWSCQHPDSKGP